MGKTKKGLNPTIAVVLCVLIGAGVLAWDMWFSKAALTLSKMKSQVCNKTTITQWRNSKL